AASRPSSMPAISALPTWARRRSTRCSGAFTTFCSPTRWRPPWHPRRTMTDIADRSLPLPPTRPERVASLKTMGAVGDGARPLPLLERLANNTMFRRLVVLLVLTAAWEAYARFAANPLLFPSFSETLVAFWDAAAHGPLIERTLTSLQVLAGGYVLGLAIA